jgi:hypothetical protein
LSTSDPATAAAIRPLALMLAKAIALYVSPSILAILIASNVLPRGDQAGGLDPFATTPAPAAAIPSPGPIADTQPAPDRLDRLEARVAALIDQVAELRRDVDQHIRPPEPVTWPRHPGRIGTTSPAIGSTSTQ